MICIEKSLFLKSNPSVKDMEYDPDKDIDHYFRDGCTLQHVGSAPERTHSIPGNLRAQRR